jgi:predicted nucleic acid-binding protein
MKYLFLDTNILLDVLLNRKPFSYVSAKIIDLSEKGLAKLYMSSLSYNTIYYILRKEMKHKDTIVILKKLEDLIETTNVSNKTIKDALFSEFNDFEDAIQNFSAKEIKKAIIFVTRNTKDYKKSSLTVMTPEEVLGTI